MYIINFRWNLLLRYISGISLAYLRQISRISLTNLRQTHIILSDKSQAYLRQTLDISQALISNIRQFIRQILSGTYMYLKTHRTLILIKLMLRLGNSDIVWPRRPNYTYVCNFDSFQYFRDVSVSRIHFHTFFLLTLPPIGYRILWLPWGGLRGPP